MKSYSERIADIAARQNEIATTLPQLRSAREEALGDGDNARASTLRAEVERNERELHDLRTTAAVIERREQARIEAEHKKRLAAARVRLAELSRARVKIGRKIDLAWAAIESAVRELEALDMKVRATSSEAGIAVEVSRRLGIHGQMLHRGAALANAPTTSILLGIQRLPPNVRRPLEAAFKALGSPEVEPVEGEAA